MKLWGAVVVLALWAFACGRTSLEEPALAVDDGKDATATDSAPTDGVSADSGSCPNGETFCHCAFPPSPPPPDYRCGSCVDERTDPNNCGECGKTCNGATSFCTNGACTTPPPSCAPSGPGLTNCGPGGSGNESCCTSLEVTGGTFFRTYKNSGVGPTGEADPATVSDFRFDKYLVTVGRFRQFVAAWRGGYYPSAGSGIHTYLNDGHGLENSGPGAAYETGWDATDWNNTTDIDPTTANLTTACNDPKFATWTATNENLPIDCLTWYEAYAFCIWDGGFLPSQAEREYAAAGGSQQREYPWGSATPGTACPGTGCDYAIYNCEFPSGPAVCSGVANIAPVGYASQGVGRWGQVDLAGEVYEWTLDVLQGLGGFTGHFPTAPCTNCAATVSNAAEPYRIIGGDDFHDAKAFLVAARNEGGDMTVRSYGIGLRCARTP